MVMEPEITHFILDQVDILLLTRDCQHTLFDR